MASKQIWFITGTSSGLGNALLHTLLSEGHSVIATSRSPDRLQSELEAKYPSNESDAIAKRLLVVKLDVKSVEEVRSVFEQALQKFGRIDVVVNNAGYTVLSEIEAHPLEHAHEQFDVMFWGPVHISREAIRVFREVNPAGSGGLIFNVSSAGGYSAQPSISYYNAAKFALEGFTESLRKEMSPEWNIQATIIEPGGFNTEWRGGNMTILPVHPAYSAPTSPVSQYRNMLDTLPFIGVPDRAAKAFLTLAGLNPEKKVDRKDLPLRVQFGSDSLAVVRHAATTTLKDSEKWEAVTHSTNIDGLDPVEYTKNLLAILGGH